jgi:hypothetical protein
MILTRRRRWILTQLPKGRPPSVTLGRYFFRRRYGRPRSDANTLRGRPVCRGGRPVAGRPAYENDRHMNHSSKLTARFQATPKNGGSRRDGPCVLPGHDGHSDVYGRIDPSLPAPTMTTACINPSKGRFVHPTEPHGITIRQAARLQTFPDHFVFKGGLMAAGVQIGNAVPVALGQRAVLRGLCLVHRSRGLSGDTAPAVLPVSGRSAPRPRPRTPAISTRSKPPTPSDMATGAMATERAPSPERRALRAPLQCRHASSRLAH